LLSCWFTTANDVQNGVHEFYIGMHDQLDLHGDIHPHSSQGRRRQVIGAYLPEDAYIRNSHADSAHVGEGAQKTLPAAEGERHRPCNRKPNAKLGFQLRGEGEQAHHTRT
jgi:hypothetical protein